MDSDYRVTVPHQHPSSLAEFSGKQIELLFVRPDKTEIEGIMQKQLLDRDVVERGIDAEGILKSDGDFRERISALFST